MDPASELAQREVFGPVLTITLFAAEARGDRIANGTGYGFSAYVQTSDLSRALRLAED